MQKKYILIILLIAFSSIIYFLYSINNPDNTSAFSYNTEFNIPASVNEQPSVAYCKTSLISGQWYKLEAEYKYTKDGIASQNSQFYFDLYIPHIWDKPEYNFIPTHSHNAEKSYKYSKIFWLNAPHTSMFFRIINTSKEAVRINNIKIKPLSKLRKTILTIVNFFFSIKINNIIPPLKLSLTFYIILIIAYFIYIISFGEKHFLFNIFLILILNSVLLAFININLLFQLLIFVLFLFFTLIGIIFLGNLRKKIPDTIILLCISGIVGMLIFTIFNYVLLHFNNNNLFQILNILFFFGIILAFILFKKNLLLKINVKISKSNILLILLISFILSATTNYGLLNISPFYKSTNISQISQIKNTNWGWGGDKFLHVHKFVAALNKTGFPEKRLFHRGIQVLLISSSRLFGHFNAATILPISKNIYKIITFFLFFILLYSFAFIGKYFFSLSKNYISLIIISIPFFNAINFPVFALNRSSYLGSFAAGATVFHNPTQLFSVTIGITGLILIFFAYKNMKTAFIYGCFIIICSFIFKPSFYTLVVPFVFIFYFFIKTIKLSDKFIGFSLLLIPPIFFHIYPKYFSTDVRSVPLKIAPFEIFFLRAPERYPPYICSNKFWLAALILILSFAIFIPLFINFIITASKTWKKPLFFDRLRTFVNINFIELFLAGLLISGTFMKIFLIEDNSFKLDGNLGWCGSAAYILFIPVIIKLISKIKFMPVFIFTYAILLLHLWGGFLHLYLFTLKNAL